MEMVDKFIRYDTTGYISIWGKGKELGRGGGEGSDDDKREWEWW